MTKWISETLDKASEYLAHRKGFLPMIGMLFILINLILNIIPYFMAIPLWLYEPNIFLHVGLLIAFLGLLLGWAL